ncbi:MAG: phage tail sheath C-terminal domain-containing protein [Bacteroidota bacterium]
MKNLLSLSLFSFSLLALFSQTHTTPGVYVQEIPSGVRSIAQVETAIPAFIGYTQKVVRTSKSSKASAVLIKSFADYQKMFGSATVGYYLAESVELFFENGGQSCYIISVGLSSSPILKKALNRGLAISTSLKVQLLLIPDAVALPAADFYTIQEQMLQQCGQLGDRFAILNTLQPSGNEGQDFQNFRSNTPSPNPDKGATYYPWLVNKQGISVPPSGAIAGVYAHIDQKKGVWKAPANVSLRGVDGLSHFLNFSQQTAANSSSDGKSINIIAELAGKGILVWGARTLAGQDIEWRYVPVRRLGLMIEESLYRGLEWVVFEPNDEPLWTQVQASVTNFLTQLYRKGAFQGSKASQAFFVKCGLGETMTAQDIADKKLIIQIGFAPLRPAEFVVIPLEIQMP